MVDRVMQKSSGRWGEVAGWELGESDRIDRTPMIGALWRCGWRGPMVGLSARWGSLLFCLHAFQLAMTQIGCLSYPFQLVHE